MTLRKAPNASDLLQFSGNRVPLILQTEAAECGLASLAMIAGYFGFQTDLSTLRRDYSISTQGTTLKQLIAIASRLNMHSRALKLEIKHLSNLQLPCILHWDLSHFVVLKSIGKNHVHINDPAIGERKVTLEELSESFSGVALELTPSRDFEPEKSLSNLRLGDFWSRIVGLKRNLVLIFLLSLLVQIFSLVTPFYIQTVVDDAVLRSDSDLVLVLAMGFGLLLAMEVAVFLLRQLLILNFSSRMSIQMASNVFRHLIHLPMQYFLTRHIGDVLSRFSSLETVRELFTNKIVAASIDGVLALFTLIVMLVYSVKLALVVLGFSVLYFMLRLVFYRPVKLLTEEGLVVAAKENSHFMESIRAIQTIKLFQKEYDRQSQWENRLSDSINKGIRLAKWNISFETSQKLLFGIENIAVIYLAALSVLDTSMSIGMLFAFVSYKTRFIESVNSLIDACIEIKVIEVHLSRLSDVLHTARDEISTSQPVREIEGYKIRHIEVLSARNLCFAYSPNDPYIFEGLDFEIRSGETVAIVGPSGCGKTTFLKCLMGLLEPSSGVIQADEKNIALIPNYRTLIAGVMQDDHLLSGSLLENITCFDDRVDMEKVINCANLACVHDEIMGFNMQYNTLVGDMGGTLSGGQKQRIVLARALYRNPSVIFLDEATSHLDVSNELLIRENLSNVQLTKVIVAHRPETIDSADRVYNLSPSR